MIGRIVSRLLLHVKRFLPAYILFFLVFIGGFISGIVSTSSLSGDQAVAMNTFLDSLLRGLTETDVNPAQEITKTILFNGSLLLMIWFLGLSVIGLPLIPAVLFYKGYTMGFCIAFMLANQLAPGLLIIFLSILPQTLVILPLIMFSALEAASFSLSLIRGQRRGAGGGFLECFGGYSLRFLALLSGVFICALAQGFISPVLLKVILNII